jgi:hypothetical protein
MNQYSWLKYPYNFQQHPVYCFISHYNNIGTHLGTSAISFFHLTLRCRILKITKSCTGKISN